MDDSLKIAKEYNQEKLDNLYKELLDIKVINNLQATRLCLNDHLTEAYTWCNILEFDGLDPNISISSTIDLDFSFTIAQSEGEIRKSKALSEKELLENKSNYLVLGDLGTGKTTTLKKIIRKCFESYKTPKLIKKFPFTYPFLLRLRSYDKEFDLYYAICCKLGLSPELKYKIRFLKDHIYQTKYFKENELAQFFQEWPGRREEIQNLGPIYTFDTIELPTLIATIFNSLNVLLILDGFDEIATPHTLHIHSQISELSLRLTNSKILITARYWSIKSKLQKFHELHINKLTQAQIIQISNYWQEDPGSFLEELERKSYKELANRPLFLCYLNFLYKEGDYGIKNVLPKTSNEVYFKLIRLMITKWDEDRTIIRTSKYSRYFNPDEKLEFLTHIAYWLMYKVETKIFTSSDLHAAYINFYEKFRLPENEVDMVVEEVQNHVGIIKKVSSEQFEFTHLAIQEYLCAKYIALSKMETNLTMYLEVHPDPLALVISLSTTPEEVFFDIAMRIQNKFERNIGTEKAIIILNRLIIEGTVLPNKEMIAFALFILADICDKTNKKFTNLFEELLLSNDGALNSVNKTLQAYYTLDLRDTKNNVLIYIRSHSIVSVYAPYNAYIPIPVEHLISRS